MKTVKTCRALMLLVAVIGTLSTLVACSAGSSGGGNTGGSTGGATTGGSLPTVSATATTKPEPSVVPLTDMAFCQHIMSLAEANQIMSPPTPADTIVPNNTSNGGSCNYTIAGRPGFAGLVLAIILQPWTGPTPVSQQDVETVIQEAASKAGADGVTLTTITTVSGVGDQAAFVAGSGSYQGFTFKFAVFYVLYGKIFFTCNNYNVGSSADATQQSDLQQCGQQVVSRL